jgi:hypothetical protein
MVNAQFLDAIALGNQPRPNLLLLYQGWVDTLIALQASQLTGTFSHAATNEATIARREAVHMCRELDMKIAVLRNIAVKEKQMYQLVTLNQEIKRHEAALAEAVGKI